MRTILISSLLLMVLVTWGCENKTDHNTVSSLDNEGPCPAEDSTVTYDTPPKVATFVAPPYPDFLPQAGHGGKVELHICVGKAGVSAPGETRHRRPRNWVTVVGGTVILVWRY